MTPAMPPYRHLRHCRRAWLTSLVKDGSCITTPHPACAIIPPVPSSRLADATLRLDWRPAPLPPSTPPLFPLHTAQGACAAQLAPFARRVHMRCHLQLPLTNCLAFGGCSFGYQRGHFNHVDQLAPAPSALVAVLRPLSGNSAASPQSTIHPFIFIQNVHDDEELVQHGRHILAQLLEYCLKYYRTRVDMCQPLCKGR